LNVGAVSDEAKLKFLRSLEDSKAFTQVALVNVRVPAQTTGVDRIILELTVTYETS